METNFNFKSQICTTKSQSEALLKLGLKKETADMYYSTILENDDLPRVCWEDFWNSNKAIDGYIRRRCIPAWSLDRLRELIPENIFTGVRNQWHRVMYNSVLSYEEGDDSLVSFRGVSIYDRCISCIYWLIKEGYFNKEYLV